MAPNDEKMTDEIAGETERISTSNQSGPALRMLIVGLVSLPLFGVPAVVHGVTELVRPNVETKRRLLGIGSIALGSIGFLASGWWWLGWERLR